EFMRDFLWLIPANDKLFEFYAKLGFEKKLYSCGNYKNKIDFFEQPQVIEYLYEGSDYKYPVGMVYSKTPFESGSTGFSQIYDNYNGG
ncbi:MAG: hypothetical protein LUG21_00535, partial [Clostridiales bacterium]|nr:hypothetical protein [Clostridiales bacterium]